MPRRNRGPRLVKLPHRDAYYIRWVEAGRSRERSTGTTDLREAETALADFLAARHRAGGGPRDPSEFPVVDALILYGEEHAPATASPARVAYAIEALTDFWSGRVLGDISSATCRAYVEHRRKPTVRHPKHKTAKARTDGTIRRELGVLRAAVNYALRHGRLTRPVTVWLPPPPEGRDRWLTRTEAAALMRAARRDKRTRLHLPLFVLVGLYTGARKEAILSLRWPQVDLDRRVIDFNTPGRRRTAKGRPIIPIPRRLFTFLSRARLRGGEMGYVVNRHGKPVGDVKRAFGSSASRAGLAGVTPHTLRHTAGTWMAQRGVPLFEIAGYLGHSHARTTELYAHHHPDYLRRAAGAFDR